MTPNPTLAPGVRPGALRRAWARVFGEADAIERQLAATAREGATLARIAHACAFLMLILFSAGSLVALAGDSLQAIVQGRASFPDIIAASVSGLLVACMDTAMLYAASILRLLAARRAAKEEGRLHRFVLFSVAILEAATYAYMSALYEHPSGVAWALIGARALAAPLLSVYLSLARPLPVMARDMLALGERIAGEGVLRDLAHIAGDASAPLVDKVALYIASAVIAPEDATRLQALLDVAQRREMMRATPPAIEAAPAPSEAQTDDSTRPPTGPGSPTRRRGVRTPAEIDAPNVVQMPTAPARRRRGRKVAKGKVRTASANQSAEAKARAKWRAGMSVQASRRCKMRPELAAQRHRNTTRSLRRRISPLPRPSSNSKPIRPHNNTGGLPSLYRRFAPLADAPVGLFLWLRKLRKWRSMRPVPSSQDCGRLRHFPRAPAREKRHFPAMVRESSPFSYVREGRGSSGAGLVRFWCESGAPVSVALDVAEMPPR